MLLALDIGGANIKAADGTGWAVSRRFPVWKDPEGLADALRDTLKVSPPCQTLAVTMTAELADCFATKEQGVRRVLRAVQEVAGSRSVLVYRTDGTLVDCTTATGSWKTTAASNWHALARFACRYLNGRSGILIDIGSTTSDLVPIGPAGPSPRGLTDTERLQAGELVYTGIGRSPVCAIVDSLPWRGGRCPVAHELFATSVDAYLMLGIVPPSASTLYTADGRAESVAAAHARLARAICADRTEFSTADAIAAATEIQTAQIALLTNALGAQRQNRSLQIDLAVISGRGEFLAREVVARACPQATVVSIAERVSPAASLSAAAHALAVIASPGVAQSADQRP